MHAVFRARGHELVHQRAGDLHRALPHPLPELVGAAEGGSGARPPIRRVEGDERLGERDELRAVARGRSDQPGGLVDGRLGVEDHRRRLDGRDPHRPERGHRGMFPCLRFGRSTRLVWSVSSARISFGRVSCGTITSSM